MSRTLFPALLVLFSTFAHGQEPNAGRALAATCANCHGTNGRAVGGMPALAGRPRAELARILREFRDGARPATVMNQLAKGFTDDQIEAVSAYLASQPLK
jgi:cytochrome subunit of sulfide dehydrogenase